MNKDEKLILVDCDGVLVDWLHSFSMWMEEHGYKELSTLMNATTFTLLTVSLKRKLRN